MIIGEVENKGNRNFAYVKVTAKLYSTPVPSINSMIGENSTYVFKYVLKPREKSPFKMYLGECNTPVKSYELSVDYSTSDENPISFGVTRNDYDSLTKEVFVRIKNKDVIASNRTKVAVTYYKGGGAVQSVDWAYLAEEIVPAGEERTIVFENAQTNQYSVAVRGKGL